MNPEPTAALHLAELLAGIRDGRWAEQVLAVRALSASSTAYSEAKRSLPCFTPSGTFERRTPAGLLQHSGIVGLDLDARQNPGVDLSAVKVLLAADPSTYACFASAGGEGLCALVRIPADNHASSFRSLKAYYHQAYGLVVDDLNDVSRLRFVSYDPALYLNEEAELLTPTPVQATTLSTSN
ncbi:hypothetical protein MON38_10605 [Hymenobacter sp. DH14]|uniref:BT4734-like N-terminal domain-containing protein n=1 Tax=Hymenobacter cyanobacteriorum TaxID=2926463 RepID=A0A9X1VK49_9BACT|nr:BT4734/BF3469 family protein [Hymenobacter cyanobacteriorum]MCI1187871.1 hypothetical protein [Hymenobacter cyanobacteriorum]